MSQTTSVAAGSAAFLISLLSPSPPRWGSPGGALGSHLQPAAESRARCCPGGGTEPAAPAGPGAALPPPAPRCTGRRAAACAPTPCPLAAAALPAAVPGCSHLPRLWLGRPELLPGQLVAAAQAGEPWARPPAPGTGSPSPGTGTAPSGPMLPSRCRVALLAGTGRHGAGTPAEVGFGQIQPPTAGGEAGLCSKPETGFPLVGKEKKKKKERKKKKKWGGGKRCRVNCPSFPVLAVKVFISLAVQVDFWREVEVLLSVRPDAPSPLGLVRAQPG